MLFLPACMKPSARRFMELIHTRTSESLLFFCILVFRRVYIANTFTTLIDRFTSKGGLFFKTADNMAYL